jgi:cellulose synthase/poly-beta-1,6-N-acetylglucosamine synthase-like glycosyltransferase
MVFWENLLSITLYTLGVFLLLNCCYILFFSVAGLKKSKALDVSVQQYRKFCILIPVYREDLVILETSRLAMQHRYAGSFDVFVIADGLQESTLKKIRDSGAKVIEVSFKKSTKGQALSAAVTELENEYDIVMVLDADNIMNENVLADVNVAFQAGYKVVQTHRVAKNKNTAFAFLDACNEEISNHIYRKGPHALGLSAALIGSGMAFEYSYFKKIIADIGETVGEDKEMDFRIAKEKIRIAYLHNTMVFDEKVENARVFTRQRTRWLASQLELLKKYSKEAFTQFKAGNVEFINKLIQVWIVPRTLLMAALVVLFLLSLVVPVGPSPFFWLILLLILFVALLIAVPGHYYKNKMLVKALLRFPYAVICMIAALFKIRSTKNSFMATAHKAVVSSEINQ